MIEKKKKILFFGTPDIAIPSLETIHAIADYEIIGVGVFPDRKVGRKQLLTPCPVKARAIELNLPIIEISNKNELESIIEKTDFDLAIVIAFGLIFPASILTSRKFINIHFSLLPKYRGASPVQSAILNGETLSGITWQVMATKLDAGDVLFQKEYDITNQRTSSLWEDFSTKTADNFPRFLHQYFKEELIAKPQEPTEATFCGKFEKNDGSVDFKTMTAQAIYQRFCAFDVWPGIFIETSKGHIKLKEISLSSSDNSYEIKCKNDSSLFLQSIQIPGKKAAPINDILLGNKDLFS